MVLNSDEDKDRGVKEQMAARYQERVSMGYTTSGSAEDSGGFDRKDSGDLFSRVTPTPTVRSVSCFDSETPSNTQGSYPTVRPASALGVDQNSPQNKRHSSPMTTASQKSPSEHPAGGSGVSVRDASAESRKSTMRELIEKFEQDKVVCRSETTSKTCPPQSKNGDVDNTPEMATCTSEIKKIPISTCHNKVTTATWSVCEDKVAPNKKVSPEVLGRKPALTAKRYLLRQMGPSSSSGEGSSSNKALTAKAGLKGHLRKKSPTPPSKLSPTHRTKSSDITTPFVRSSLKTKMSLMSMDNSITNIPKSTSTGESAASMSKGTDNNSGTGISNNKELAQKQGDTLSNTQKHHHQQQIHQHQRHDPQHQQQQQQQQQKQKQQQRQQQPTPEQRSQLSPIPRKYIHRKIRRRSPAVETPSKRRSSTAMERYLRFLKNSSPSALDIDVLSNPSQGNNAQATTKESNINDRSTPSTPPMNQIAELKGNSDGTKTGSDSRSTLPKDDTIVPKQRSPTMNAMILLEPGQSDKDMTDVDIDKLSAWHHHEPVQQLRTMDKRSSEPSVLQMSNKSWRFSGTQQRTLEKRGSSQIRERGKSLLGHNRPDSSTTSTASVNIRNTLSSRNPGQEHKGKVSNLLTRYEEAKTVLQQHQLSKKSSDRGLYNIRGGDHLPVDITDNLLLTEDQLADTNLIPVHLRQRRFYTSPVMVSQESLGDTGDKNFIHLLTGLSSSDDEESSYMSISERLKQIKANRLLRMVKDPDNSRASKEDSLVNLFNNFVEAVSSRDSNCSPGKRSRKASTPSPKAHSPTLEDLRNTEGDVGSVGLDKYFSTLDKDALMSSGPTSKKQRRTKSKDQVGWDSPGFKVNNYAEHNYTSSSPRSNHSRPSHKSVSGDGKSPGKQSPATHCEGGLGGSGFGSGGSLYSSCVSDKKFAQKAHSPSESRSGRRRRLSQSTTSQIGDPRFLLDEEFLMLLEQNPVFSSSESSMVLHQMMMTGEQDKYIKNSGLTKAQYAKSKRRAEKREKGKKKPKRKTTTEETKAKSIKKMNTESSDFSSKTAFLQKRTVSPKKYSGRLHGTKAKPHNISTTNSEQTFKTTIEQVSSGKDDNKGVHAPFARQDTKARKIQAMKAKQESKSPSRLPLRQVKSSIYTNTTSQDASVASTNTIKEDQENYDKMSAKSQTTGHTSPSFKKGPPLPKAPVSPTLARSSRTNSPTKLRYQEPEVNETPSIITKIAKIKRRTLPYTGLNHRWAIKSNIPVLTTARKDPQDHRGKAEVLVQYRRSLKTGIAVTNSFRKKLNDAAYKEWALHKWILPLTSTNTDDSSVEIVDAEDGDTSCCEVTETANPSGGGGPIKRRLNRLHGICLGVWLTMAGIAHLGAQLYTCNGDEYDYYCKNDDLQCILPPVF